MSAAFELSTKRLRLLAPGPALAARVLAYYERNRDHLEPVEPARPSSFYTLEHWERSLQEAQDALAAGTSVRLYALWRDQPEGPVVAQVALNNLVRGAAQTASLGYSVDQRHQGEGLMREAVEAVVQHAFRGLKLHRVAASYLPDNERSGRLLKRLGFRVEGYAHEYLKIDGRWRDHILTARLNPQPDG